MVYNNSDKTFDIQKIALAVSKNVGVLPLRRFASNQKFISTVFIAVLIFLNEF